MKPESKACIRLRAGDDLELAGDFGKAQIERESESFCVRVILSNAQTVFRRFSEPQAAIYWAYGQIKPSAPGWLR